MKSRIAVFLLLLVCSAAHAKVSAIDKPGQLFGSGDYIGAIVEFNSALSVQLSDEDKKAAYLYLGKSYEKTGGLDKAMGAYQLGAQFFPKDIPLLLALADIYQKTDLLESAKLTYLGALKLEPQNLSLNKGVAETYFRLGFLSRAAAHYKTAIDLSPERDVAVWGKLAQCLFKQRKYNEAEDLVLRILLYSQNDANVWVLLSKIYYESGRKNKALSSIIRADELSGGRKDIRLLRSLWLSSSGQADEGEKLAQSVLAKEPNEPLAFFAMAISLLKRGKVEAAENYFKLAEKFADSSPFIAKVSRAMAENISRK